MPIARGEDWGRSGQLEPGAPVAGDDKALANLIGHRWKAVGLSSGDLARTLGIREPPKPGEQTYLVQVDAVRVRLDDGEEHMAIAHVTVGRPGWASNFVAIMNAAFVGSRNVAPRAHPGDGKLDVIAVSLGLGDRLKAWRRMPTGTHVPHPGITTRRVGSGTIEVPKPRTIFVDGERRGRSATVEFAVSPGALTVAVGR